MTLLYEMKLIRQAQSPNFRIAYSNFYTLSHSPNTHLEIVRIIFFISCPDSCGVL